MGNVLLVILNIPLVGLWVKLLSVPYHLLFPVMVACVCIGVYSVSNSVVDIYVLLVFGLIGTVLKWLRFDGATLLLGFVLGPMIEEYFRRAMVVSNGEFSSFWERPISAVFGFATIALVLFTVMRMMWAFRRPRRAI